MARKTFGARAPVSRIFAKVLTSQKNSSQFRGNLRFVHDFTTQAIHYLMIQINSHLI